jgi:hypothetical protein
MVKHSHWVGRNRNVRAATAVATAAWVQPVRYLMQNDDAINQWPGHIGVLSAAPVRAQSPAPRQGGAQARAARRPGRRAGQGGAQEGQDNLAMRNVVSYYN